MNWLSEKVANSKSSQKSPELHLTLKVGLAFFYLCTDVAGLEEDRAFLVCLIHSCLVWDLLLMTKELCSLLLSPCSNDVLSEGGVHHPRRRWRSQS
jgi:hypothetical protein